MLRSIQRLLNAEGFSVETFVSAEAFVDGAGSSRATCIVLDIHLPGMSGLELRSQLIASGWNLPVIFITAIDDDAPRTEAKQLGCAAYLNKPFAPEALVAAVAKALAARKPN